MAALAHAIFALILCAINGANSDGHNQLVIILFDGFRWDYLEIDGLQAFPRFKTDGAWAEKMIPAYPSLSYPSYYTIMTGLYSEVHGMVGNNFYDPLHEEPWLFAGNPEYNHTHFYDDGEPVWITATKQGRRCALYYWAACEIPIRKTLPEYCDPYVYYPNQTIVHSALIRTLDNLENGFDFVAVYTEETDMNGHKYGPFSAMENQTVLRYDEELLFFLDGLEERNLTDKVNVILVSDHGMMAYDTSGEDRSINITSRFTQEEYEENVLWILDWMVYPRYPNQTAFVYDKLKDLHPHLHVFLKQDFPDKYHFKHDRRIAPVLFYLDPPYYAVHGFERRANTTPGQKGAMGSHGYPPDLTDMQGIFMAMGPDISKGVNIPTIDAVDIYQLMCKILDIKPAPNNGSWSDVDAMTTLTSSAKLNSPGCLFDILIILSVATFFAQNI